MNLVKFKPDHKMESGVWGNEGQAAQYVLLDGEPVGVVRRRAEWYGNLGHKGVTYRYFDFFRLDDGGKAAHETTVIELRDGTKREERRPLASSTKRKEAVAAGLVLLGHLDAARTVDAVFADHAAARMERS